MRLPPITQLDRDQREIYVSAPSDGAILVVGAPGTGKTVMAFHRGQKLAALKHKPSVIMLNRVLSAYAADGDAKQMPLAISTMHSWVTKWWMRGFGPRKRPPSKNGRWYDLDWNGIAKEVCNYPSAQRAKFHWDHLIIDEGQDFPQEMYFGLNLIRSVLFKDNPPGITVFADDNQRMGDTNSTTEQISTALGILRTEKRFFILKKNYRNTNQVASFAQYFQIGHRSGAALLPTRKGPLPYVVLGTEQKDIVGYIVDLMKARPGKTIGVLVPNSNKMLKSIVNKLNFRLKGGKARVQAYISDDEEFPSDKLKFEKPDTITVLNMASAKGLEFDITFLVGLERVGGAEANQDSYRMQLYVMSSRAREELCLGIEVGTGELPPVVSLLPQPTKKLAEYLSRPDRGALAALLKDVQWEAPPIEATTKQT